MNEMHSWNRKDDLPELTVKKFKDIFDKNGIHTVMVSENSYNNKWFSCRIELEDLPGIGSNGKGITREYALASAYGELAERIEAGFLLDPLFQCREKKKDNELRMRITAEMLEYFKNELINETNEEMAQYVGCLDTVYRFTRASDRSTQYLPKRLIDSLCGSNGLAAGNTYEEAFTQGMGEVFERYVTQVIYKSEYAIDLFPSLDRAMYINLRSYELIKEIEKKGYKVNIRNCTLGGKLPVIAVVLTDPTNSRYFMKVGSDINLDICIQRCITEVFQGISFDLSFRKQMIPFYKEGSWSNVNVGCDLPKEYIKAEINGRGALPRQFILGSNYKSSNIYPFCNDDLTNSEAAKKMLEIAQKELGEVYVSDMNTMGIPALRIFIKNCCSIFHYPGERPLHIMSLYKKARTLIAKGDMRSEEMLNTLVEIGMLLCNSYVLTMTSVFGVALKASDKGNLFHEYWDFVLKLAIMLQKYEIAIKATNKLEQNVNTQKRNEVLRNIIQVMKMGGTKQECIELLYHMNYDNDVLEQIEKVYDIKENGISNIGGECDKCYFNEMCCTDNYELILRKSKGGELGNTSES